MALSALIINKNIQAELEPLDDDDDDDIFSLAANNLKKKG
jgi:hypothetical protein